MAIDVYLQIDGIKGESQDDKHKDWIEICRPNGVWRSLSAHRDRPPVAAPLDAANTARCRSPNSLIWRLLY